MIVGSGQAGIERSRGIKSCSSLLRMLGIVLVIRT